MPRRRRHFVIPLAVDFLAASPHLTLACGSGAIKIE
jgi:hypothetical protein